MIFRRFFPYRVAVSLIRCDSEWINRSLNVGRVPFSRLGQEIKKTNYLYKIVVSVCVVSQTNDKYADASPPPANPELNPCCNRKMLLFICFLSPTTFNLSNSFYADGVVIVRIRNVLGSYVVAIDILHTEIRVCRPV